mmetsp:Transcript_8695/g.16033  ORF Transcript_8695/g.16033 Transcript_8695/m.16033 type:complete len:202 (+) Transcript_8695:149-754(+)|eukprot:CAMPEP_0197516000 /NCGR_PEP_ID=MMETSP1318-20131121/928_1 /TAXON_ID=552666 /ORGANISM="Partenskyella glossopodia, Strain RCC365" /LENGTH=201 /DNA_ID=CAMNT_0043064495 /DNA_START=129 /DNA_END=734 /DNA_ORIENTATION=+
MNKANQDRVEKWKQQKVAEWEKGGKLREKCKTREDLEKWMDGQISKAQKRLGAPKAKKPKTSIGGTSDDDPEVTWEDQQRINAYGRLNQRMLELDDEIKEQKSLVQSIIDASQDIEALIDDDACKIKVGEIYVQVDNDEAEEFVVEKQKETQEYLDKLLAEKRELVTKMETLKVILKGKFGKNINLDATTEEDHLLPEGKR